MKHVIADILVLLGTAGATMAVVGVVRSGSAYVQIYASALAVWLGAMIILAAVVTTAQPALIGRAVLVAGFLALTTPASSHAVARLQFLLDRRAPEAGPAQEGGDGSQTNRASPG